MQGRQHGFKKIITIECFLPKNMKYFDKLLLIRRLLDDDVKKKIFAAPKQGDVIEYNQWCPQPQFIFV